VTHVPGRGRGRGRVTGVRGDGGQIALLVLVDVLVAAALVLVVTSAGAVHLARHRLQAVADAAALDAADALDEGRFYAGAGRPGTPVPLTADTVHASVTAHLAAAGPDVRLPPVRITAAGTADGVTADVTLATTVPLPLITFLASQWSDGVPVEVTGRARAVAVP